MKNANEEMRKFLFVFFLSIISFAAKAQVGEYRTDFAVGVNGGYVLSNIGFQPDVPQSMLGGMTMGVTLRYTCEKYFKSICAIVAEVNLVQTGWKEKIQGLENQPLYYEGSTEALHYQRKMTIQGFFQVGPQLGIFLSESTTTNLVDDKEPTEQRSSNIVKQESMPVEKKFDYGIAGGAGIEFSVPKVGHFMLEGRYYYGLGNIYGNSKSDYFGKSNFGQIVIKATYLFDIVKTKNDNIVSEGKLWIITRYSRYDL